MENHGTKSNVGTLDPSMASRPIQQDYHIRVEALHAAVAIQPKTKGEGETNPSAGQLIADADKILTFLKGE